MGSEGHREELGHGKFRNDREEETESEKRKIENSAMLHEYQIHPR